MSKSPQPSRPGDNRPPNKPGSPGKSGSPKPTPKRICRTPEEAFQAGWDDGANDPAMTPEQRRKVLGLVRPYRDQLIKPAA